MKNLTFLHERRKQISSQNLNIYIERERDLNDDIKGENKRKGNEEGIIIWRSQMEK